MFQHTTFAKKSVLSRTAFFVDFDGTLFTPDKKIISAPVYNTQTNRLLHKQHIPLVIVTGRSTWTKKSDAETILLGLSKPDAVIAGAGSIIYYRLSNGQLALDTSWDKYMRQTAVQWQHAEKTLWNRETILQRIRSLLPTQVEIHLHTADTYLIRLYVKNMPIKKLWEIKKTIEKHVTQGIQVIFTEKLLQENSLEIFSGNILVVPSTAGKEHAVKYLLKTLPFITNAYCFGDATIDIPMLTMKSEPKKYTMHTYGVNLTPLAKKSLQAAVKNNPQLHIIEFPPSPQAILEVAQTNFLSIRQMPAIVAMKRKTQQAPSHFSLAQNTPVRLLLKPFESFLDTFFDQRLSANQISFKGLEMIQQSIDLLYAGKRPNALQKLLIWKLYASGNLTDIFDGIRARQTNTMSNDGQLTDVFCDRAKEFYQVYKRAEKRLPQNQQQGYYTFFTAISCILPSIARAQAEISGTIVKEQDPKGGSMLARTRKLVTSFFFESLGLHQESFAIDQQIYATNIATYQNRICVIPRSIKNSHTTALKDITGLQQKAQERYVLLVQLLQEENAIVEKALHSYPDLAKRYDTEFKKYFQKYLKTDVAKQRKELAIHSSIKLSLYK